MVVVGDLNCQDSDPEHRVLTGLTGLRDLAAETGSRAPTALRSNPYRRGSPKPDRRIDYVMARDGDQLGLRAISVERVFDEPFAIDGREAACSDHAGVLAELEVVPAARRERRANRAGAGIALTAASLAALAPSLDFFLSSEWLVPGDIDAFGQAGMMLARMRAEGMLAQLA